jgi:hypothetical protein
MQVCSPEWDLIHLLRALCVLGGGHCERSETRKAHSEGSRNPIHLHNKSGEN